MYLLYGFKMRAPAITKIFIAEIEWKYLPTHNNGELDSLTLRGFYYANNSIMLTKQLPFLRLIKCIIHRVVGFSKSFLFSLPATILFI